MKRILYYFYFILFLLALSGCNRNNNITQPDKEDRKSGSVLFKIDKANTPEDVVKITAYLTRSGYDTVKSSMSILTDSTADLTVNELAEGTWHLEINAENSADKVIYSGESDVDIKEGSTTQVNITLYPASAGTGNVYITVGWGKYPDKWIDYSYNPVFTYLQSPTNPSYGVDLGKVFWVNGKYVMWYANHYNSGLSDVGYAVSDDGISWQSANGPVLTKGIPGSWDEYSVAIGAVLHDGNVFRMYYTGWNQYDNSRDIGMAVSSDGLHWEKHPYPVLLAGNEIRIQSTDVIKVNGTYFMYYSFKKDPYINVYGTSLATSADGINWTKYSGNPILVPTQAWEGSSVLDPTVIYDNNKFLMYYMNGNFTGFGMAVSTDGKNWEKSIKNPVFTISDTHNLWASNILYPFLRKFGNKYSLYYTGRSLGGLNQIAVANNYVINLN